VADLWYDVDVALAEVPVNIFPLVDDTDFKSIEGAVAYNAGGMALRWHFVTPQGAYTVTSVTPTTGGDYDWIDQGDSGIYTIEIPASGGASINNDTEGFGWFTGVCTGVLPWRGPICGFRNAAMNVALITNAVDATYRGAVTGATTTTTLIDSSLTQSGTDHWKGRIVIFTTGALKYQASDITAFDAATDKITFTAMTAAASGGDQYIIV